MTDFTFKRAIGTFVLVLLSLALTIILAQSTVSADKADILEPNLFNLQDDSARIFYRNARSTGEPLFVYRTDSGILRFSGDEIREETTSLGKLETVTIDSVPDLRTVTLTLIVPDVNLPTNRRQIPIKTIAISTTNATSIGGPALVKGPLQTYQTLELEGTARFVE